MTHELLKGLSRDKFEAVKKALKGQPFEIEFDISLEGNYLIHIGGQSISTTTIVCDEEGCVIHWGINTSDELKSTILNAMQNN